MPLDRGQLSDQDHHRPGDALQAPLWLPEDAPQARPEVHDRDLCQRARLYHRQGGRPMNDEAEETMAAPAASTKVDWDKVEFKPLFVERYSKLTDWETFRKCSLSYLRKAIRVNTLKISVAEI